MSKLETMQRLAEREATRLGIEQPIRVVWQGTITRKSYDGAREKPCRLRKYTLAHAHSWKGDPDRGTICIRRGLADWRETIKHEVAHFAKGGDGHGPGFLVARAKQGSRAAKHELRQRGKLRCPRHEWSPDYGDQRERRVSARGLVLVVGARCRNCGKCI